MKEDPEALLSSPEKMRRVRDKVRVWTYVMPSQRWASTICHLRRSTDLICVQDITCKIKEETCDRHITENANGDQVERCDHIITAMQRGISPAQMLQMCIVAERRRFSQLAPAQAHASVMERGQRKKPSSLRTRETALVSQCEKKICIKLEREGSETGIYFQISSHTKQRDALSHIASRQSR